MTDAELYALLRPHLARALAEGERRGRAAALADLERERLSTFAADSDDSPHFRPAFTAADVARIGDYFADADGAYPGTLHRHFGMGLRAFAEATGLVRRHSRGADGRGEWHWVRRAAPPADAPDAFAELSDADLATFAARKDGDTWRTGNRIYTRQNGKTTWRSATAAPPAAPAAPPSPPAPPPPPPPAPPPPPPTKTQQKQQAQAAAVAALAPMALQLRAGGALKPADLAALPGHLAQLSAAQLAAFKQQVGAKASGAKAALVAKLVAHATAQTQRVTSPPPPPPPPPPPSKTQLRQQAQQQALTAATAAFQAVANSQVLSPADLAALPGHLSNLTVAQLQQLKQQHGVWALRPDRTKADHVNRLVSEAQRRSQAAAQRQAWVAQNPPAPPAAPPAPVPPPPAPVLPPIPAFLQNPPPPVSPPPLPTPAALQGQQLPASPPPPPPGFWARLLGRSNTAAPAAPQQPAAPLPGNAPPGPPPRPGLVWDPNSHRWVRPGVPAPAQPGSPPAPNYTGVDANDDHWVDGKPVAKPPAETHWETGKAQPGASLNGVAFASAPPKFWEKTKDVDVGEPKPVKRIDRVSVMIQEPDGRVWIVQPTNQYGNRKYTLAGGGVEKGLTDQQNALKEVWEETGLQVEITGHLGDFEDSNNGNNGRLYIGRRVGGAPWDAKVESFIIDQKTGKPAAESSAVSLVTPEQAAKLLHRTDDLAQLMTVLPPKVDTPTRGTGSEPLKKFLAGIQPKVKAFLDAQKAKGSNRPGNAELHAVQEMRGFNKKPTVVAKTDMDALLAKGDHIEMLRGVGSVWYGPPVNKSASGKEVAEEFRSGDHYPGYGVFGSGTYADSNKHNSPNGNVASSYAGGGGVIRMALPKTAKIISVSELEAKVPRPPEGFKGYKSVLGGKEPEEDWLGVQAALAGYDAIYVDGKSRRHPGYGKGFYVVLNRGALVVQQEDATGHQIK